MERGSRKERNKTNEEERLAQSLYHPTDGVSDELGQEGHSISNSDFGKNKFARL